MSNIIDIDFGKDKSINGDTLIKLGENKNLARFAIVCLWDNDTISAGWSDDMDGKMLSYMNMFMGKEIMEYPEKNPEKCKDW